MTSEAIETQLQALTATVAVLAEAVRTLTRKRGSGSAGRNCASARACTAAPKAQPAEEPVAWKHDCAALLTNGVELWVDRCPHCGKPRPVAAQQPAVQEQFTQDELDLLRQWYNSMQDTNGGYIIDGDRRLYEKIVAALKAVPQAQPAIPLAATCHCACVIEGNKVVEFCKMHGTQQPRKAVKLTPEEMKAAVEHAWRPARIDAAIEMYGHEYRAIEQAVLKKNGVTE